MSKDGARQYEIDPSCIRAIPIPQNEVEVMAAEQIEELALLLKRPEQQPYKVICVRQLHPKQNPSQSQGDDA